MAMRRRDSRLRMAGGMTLLLLVLFVIPAGVPTLGYLPGVMRSPSVYQLLKMQMSAYSCETAALSPCTAPAGVGSEVTGHSSRLQELLEAEPYKEVKPSPQSVEKHARAIAWIHQTQERKQRYTGFMPGQSPVQRAQLVLTWRVLHEALTLHNITHFLVDGTLLGTLRHGGLIPWDDEMDIAIHEDDLDKARRALSCIPGYTLQVQNCYMWKFFASDANLIPLFAEAKIYRAKELSEAEKRDYTIEMQPFFDVAVRTPFVDIFLLTTDGTYLWSLARFNQRSTLYRREDVYPLTQIVFEGQPAPAPRHSLSIMKRTFDVNTCASPGNDHKIGKPLDNITYIQCQELSDIYTVNHL